MSEKVKNILVLGANGLLGTMFRENISHDYKDNNWVFCVRTEESKKNEYDIVFDCAKKTKHHWEELLQGQNIVINCTAATKVDAIESDIESACASHEINFRAMEILSEVCKEKDITLIHFSTDYVFNGESTRPYCEFDCCNPINRYGEDKYRGELAIRNSGCKYLIFRTSWVYSHNPGNFFTNMLDKIDKGTALFYGVSDIISSPTYADDLAKAVINIIVTNQEHKIGVYHYTNEGVCTRYDFMQAVKNLNEREDNYCEIEPVPNSFFNCPTRRPAYSVMSKTLVQNVFKIGIPHWMDSLKRCYDKYKTQNNL